MAKVKNLLKRLKGIPTKKKIILVILSVLIMGSLLVYFFLFFNKDLKVKKQSNVDQVVTYSTDKPSEQEVEDFDVPADMPKRINLKTIEKSGYIQTVGIDQYGNIAVPSNVLMAGWYINTQRPGEVGLSIITGHRDGVLKNGIFRQLQDLKKGDEFDIEYGDNSMRYFKVVDIKEVTIEQAYDLMYEKRDDIEKQLNLVTCSGRYQKDDETYDKRTIVISKRIQ